MFGFAISVFDSELLLEPQLSGLHPVIQIPLLLLFCAVPLALLLWLYRYELQLISRGTALCLLGLRLVAVVLILFLVCLQPIYARNWTEQLPGRVLVVVDRSGSMEVTDPQRQPVEKLRLARALGLASDLCSDELLSRWIEEAPTKLGQTEREPRWVLDEEAPDDPKQRAELQTQRQRAYKQILKRVDDLTRTETARKVLFGDKVQLLSTIQARHNVEVLGFNQVVWDVESGKEEDVFPEPGEEKKEEEKEKGKEEPKEVVPSPDKQWEQSAFTDLRLPLVRAFERSGPGKGKVLGVILLTDGQHNLGDPPNRKAQELGERNIPIYPLALGARQPPPDVALVSVKAPHAVFKDVDAPVEVRFKITGLPAGEFVVDLYRAGAQEDKLAERTIQHDGKDREYLETFPVRMDRAGTQSLVARVRRKDGGEKQEEKESRADNNTLATTINVADDHAKVLLIDGEARWEFHYLAVALERDRSMKLERIVFHQPRLNPRLSARELEAMGSPREKWPEGPDALADFDCIILGDVSEEDLPLQQRKQLENYVANRGGTLVVTAGKRYMPLGYPERGKDEEADPLAQLLPIEQPRVFKPLDGFRLTLTQAGRQTPFMELDAELGKSMERWARLPRHFWAVIGRAKPGATALAYLPEKEDEEKPQSVRERENAVIVRHNYGFGRVLYVGLDTTWRWRYKVGDTYHHRFWSQAIKWAASDKPLVTGNEFVRFGTFSPVYRQGQSVPLVLRLEEKAGPIDRNLLAGARILKLGEEEGKEEEVALVPLTPRAAQPRVLEGKLDGLAGGAYAIELFIPDLADKLLAPGGKPGSPEQGREGKPLRASFLMLPPQSREGVDLETKYPLLEELAIKSDGKVFTPEDAHELAALLSAQSIPHRQHHEQKLWQSWWILVLVVFLLTLEWVGRKWAGLP
jgi:hypothetical protein